METLPDNPSEESIAYVLDHIQAPAEYIEHIHQYIQQLQDEIAHLQSGKFNEFSPLRHEQHHANPASPQPEDTSTPPDKLTILIVEDDVSINVMIKTIVEAEGYTALTAENGRDGIDLALSHTPDLIICDIHLPGMHGLDVIRAFKQAPSLKDKPILMLTADLFKAEESFDIGADEYILKPIRKNQLMLYVSKYLPVK